ncbi:MAG TPA: hypothetical protein VKF59_02300, partial [Candidatus Dormibacteraeota bacterium]|nr:hypothetical protein [Candidatus Dormibacteraeota bacterium]
RARPLLVLDRTPLGFGSGLPDRDLEGVLVGEATVGETGPEDPATFGAAAFDSTAHRFTVLVPPAPGLDRALVTSVVEAEKPAHTAFHVCFVRPAMRVGLQARVGLDAIVAGAPAPMALDQAAALGVDSRLAGAGAGARRVGIDTRIR